MNINAHWVRWIISSVNTHFNSCKGSYTLYYEGDDRDTNDETDFAEVRVDGPFIKTPCKGLTYLDIEINLLIQSVVDPENLYQGLVTLGQFATGFTRTINVLKNGTGDDDDGTLLGCLTQRDRRTDDTIDIGNFGIIRPDSRITQHTLEGHYRLELEE